MNQYTIEPNEALNEAFNKVSSLVQENILKDALIKKLQREIEELKNKEKAAE